MAVGSNRKQHDRPRAGAQSAVGGATADAKAPLAVRLRAWWDGSSVREVLAEEARRKSAAAALSPNSEAGFPLADPAPGSGKPQGPAVFWSAARIAVAEQLFGRGEIVPGGTERTLDMIGAFGLGQEVNVLNIGAGLGGSARAIASKYEGWVTAYESDPALAQAALDPARNRVAVKSSGFSLKPMRVKMKLSDKATILHADLETVEIKPGVYDCAFSRDVLFGVANKGRLLAGIFDGLKPFGPLLFTDYFVAEGAQGDARLQRWMAREPHPVHPWTQADSARVLTEIGYDLRVDQDITHQHRQDLFRGFAAFVAAHEEEGLKGEMAEALAAAAELWAHRVEVMDAGLVTVRKIVALRPKDS